MRVSAKCPNPLDTLFKIPSAEVSVYYRRNRLPPTVIDRRYKDQKQTAFGISHGFLMWVLYGGTAPELSKLSKVHRQLLAKAAIAVDQIPEVAVQQELIQA